MIQAFCWGRVACWSIFIMTKSSLDRSNFRRDPVSLLSSSALQIGNTYDGDPIQVEGRTGWTANSNHVSTLKHRRHQNLERPKSVEVYRRAASVRLRCHHMSRSAKPVNFFNSPLGKVFINWWPLTSAPDGERPSIHMEFFLMSWLSSHGALAIYKSSTIFTEEAPQQEIVTFKQGV